MTSGCICALGKIAMAVRNAGLGLPLEWIRNLLDAFFLRMEIPPLSTEVEGMQFHGFLRHRSFLEELSSGSYESTTRQLFLEALDQADVVVDAGAHIGLFSVMAGRFGKSGLRIFSFEPDPYNVKALRYNLQSNQCDNARMFPAAVSDSCGIEPMLISDGSISSSLLLGRTNIGRTKSWIVRTMTLDSVLRDISVETLLVKLDIEGAEIPGLLGGSASLKRASRLAIFCEINPSALQAGGRNPAGLIRSLQSTGGRIFYIAEKDNGLIPVTESFVAKGNLLCVRNWPINEERILS